MKINLGYCTNIHPGETWEQVFDNLKKYIPLIKSKFSPNEPLGIGLRLSNLASEQLNNPKNIQEFKKFLKNNNVYVYTINGFIYGHFHNKPVKEKVYQPDWRFRERVSYTNILINILTLLLDENFSTYGSISSLPLAFKEEIKSNEDDIKLIVKNLCECVIFMYNIYKNTDKIIKLGLEPEAGCLLESTDEVCKFFKEKIFNNTLALEIIKERCKVSQNQAREILENHLGICYDTCHQAIQYENPVESLNKLKENNINITKFQISAGLKLNFNSNEKEKIIKILTPFNEKIYLHQVIEKRKKENILIKYKDLNIALKKLQDYEKDIELEWRIHYHVPIFKENLENFTTTQSYIKEIFNYLKTESKLSTNHFEIETYTWEVLPEEYKNTTLEGNIIRELIFVKENLL